MKLIQSLAILVLALQTAPTVQAQLPSQQQTTSRQDELEIQKIESVLKLYEQALNANDVKGVMQVYGVDPVVLVPETQPSVGRESVQNTYTGLFQAVNLHLRFHVAEVKLLTSEWAFLRSTSKGTIKLNANGAQIPSSNQELFVLQKHEGSWKIARYSFSSSLPKGM